MTDDLPDPAQIPVELRPTARIRASRDGSWEPAEDGFEAFLMPVHDWLSQEVIDVAAWDVTDTAHWWLRWRRASYAGERAIWCANRDGKPVEIVRNPDEYLKRWGCAVCILDWSADIAAILGTAKHGIFSDDLALLDHIRRVVNRRPAERLKIVTVAA